MAAAANAESRSDEIGALQALFCGENEFVQETVAANAAHRVCVLSFVICSVLCAYAGLIHTKLCYTIGRGRR
jgi:hypothetical protein